MIVTGGPHASHFMQVLKNGKSLGVRHLEFAYQEGEGGIPVALSYAEHFAGGGNVAVILGDNTTDADIRPAVEDFKGGATIFLKKVPDPKRFGVAEVKDSRILGIEEKPENPKSNFAVTGLYLYDNRVFEIIKKLKPSKRGELEITDVNRAYLEEGRLQWSMLDGYWSDAGTFETLFEVNIHEALKSGDLEFVRRIREIAEGSLCRGKERLG